MNNYSNIDISRSSFSGIPPLNHILKNGFNYCFFNPIFIIQVILNRKAMMQMVINR